MNDRLPGSSYDSAICYRSFRIYISDGCAPRSMAYEYVHEDYDGAPDAEDSRCGHEASVQACKDQIDEWYLDQDAQFLNAMLDATQPPLS